MDQLPVGVTIAPDGARYAVLRLRGDGARIERAGRIPRGIGVSDADLIRMIRDAVGAGSRRIRIVDEVQPAVLRMVSLPPMPPKDRALALSSEAQMEIEILGGEVQHAWVDLPSDGRGSRSLLAVMPRARIQELTAGCSRSGFLLEAICVPPILLLDLLRSRDLVGEAETVAAVDVGQGRVHLTLIRDGRLENLRQIQRGMDASFLLAGERREPRAAVGGGSMAPGSGEFYDQIDRGLLDLVELVDQIRKTLRHHESQREGDPVTRIWLAGEATGAESLAPLLQNDLRIPVEILPDPPWEEGAGEIEAREAPSFTLTFAASALRTEETSLSFVLHAPRREGLGKWRALSAAAIATCLALGYLVQTEARSVSGWRSRLAERPAPAALPAEPPERALQRWLGALEGRMRPSVGHGDLIERVAAVLPGDAWLEAFHLEDGDGRWIATLEGLVAGETPSQRQRTLERFLADIRATGSFPAMRLGPIAHRSLPSDAGRRLQFTLVLSNRPIATEGSDER